MDTFHENVNLQYKGASKHEAIFLCMYMYEHTMYM